tara:strand:+ start:555 stop:1223 length:669 start_codon:yes stop_codon:yes gene_type:complete
MTDTQESLLAEGSDQATSQMSQFLTFDINNERYGVNILAVREIKGHESTTKLPNTPDCMQGIINLRGIVIPIFDIRMMFGMGAAKDSKKNVTIILSVEGQLIGIIVDAVSDIIETKSGEVKPAPTVQSGVDQQYISGVVSKDDGMIIILDTSHLLSNENMLAAKNVATSQDADIPVSDEDALMQEAEELMEQASAMVQADKHDVVDDLSDDSDNLPEQSQAG